ncbi:unnamed protein product [Lactuca saligna]|uniref:Uncharacterized protein n=1 Tax=Lactuca saligna TaxID=75948 RepID=A0AA35YSF5_LACSI|nr:unnamed protein product [Lactuca saligna]
MGEGVSDTAAQDSPKTVNDDETDDGGFVGSFADIEFDLTKENIPDHMLISGIEVDVMLKAHEHHLQESLDRIQKNNELRVKAQSENLNGDLRALKDVVKERYVLYVQDVKTIREDVNLKLQELRQDMAKEISILTHNYSTIHMKVDIIADVVTKAIEWYNSFTPKFEKKVEVDATNFGDMAK